MSQSQSQTSGGSTVAASSKSLSFDEISKLFSLPIAEAASILGVCTSVLKRICRENGIVRWPYRKFLAGKSIEEIQKDAARERKKELAEMSKAARNAAGSPGVSSTSGTQLQTNILSSGGAHILQLQGNNRPLQNGSNNMLHQPSSGLPKNIPAYVDEFKQGFPSNGLSAVSIRWWGSSSPDDTTDDFDDIVSEPEEQDEEPPPPTTTTTTTNQVDKQSSLGEPATTITNQVDTPTQVEKQSSLGEPATPITTQVDTPTQVEKQSSFGEPTTTTTPDKVDKPNQVDKQSSSGEPATTITNQVDAPNQGEKQSSFGEPTTTTINQVDEPNQVDTQSSSGEPATTLTNQVDEPSQVDTQSSSGEPATTTTNLVDKQSSPGEPATTTTNLVDKQSSSGEPSYEDGVEVVDIVMEEKPSLDNRGETTEDGVEVVDFIMEDKTSLDNRGETTEDGVEVVDIIMEEKPSLDDRRELTEVETSKSRNSDDIGPQGTALLLSVRKRAAEEGREALKLGASRHSTLELFKVGRRESLLLRKVFKSSLTQS